MRSLPILATQAPAGPRVEPRADPRSVRVSLTDRCDLACLYCRPDKQDGYYESTLELAAFETLLRGLAQGGVTRVRITGGEPLLSPIVVEAVRAVVALGFEDVALTTNATRLTKLAASLKAAGLQRINVSLDTLVPERFERMTRGGRLRGVLEGIAEMRRVGFEETKLNVVVVRGENDDELEALAQFAWENGMTPRFLEVMAIGEGAKMQDKIVPYSEQRERLTRLLEPDVGTRDTNRGPARYVRSRTDPNRRIGFITGTTDTYCSGCDRLRVTADGTLRPCLAKNDGVSAADEATRGDAFGVAERLVEAWRQKPDGETFRGCTEPSAADVSIRKIGG